MSLDQTNSAKGDPAGEIAVEEGRGRVSLWFLTIPIAVTLAVATLAFFLLSRRDNELLTTTDNHAVAVAVANAQPAPAAFNATTPAAQPASDTRRQ